MPAGFEPKSGSVSAKQPSFSPRAIAGSQRVFLFVGTEEMDRHHGERALHGGESAQAAVAAFEFLHDESGGDAPEPGT